MSQPDFNDYLNTVCAKIKSKHKRAEIEEELLCHLEDNYERNLAVGMSEEEAREDAVNKMGSTETLAYRFGELYSYSPLKAMSSAVATLIAAFWLIFFPITISFKEFFFVIGLFAMFSALLRMRKVNEKLKYAFVFFSLYAVVETLSYFASFGRDQTVLEKRAFIIIGGILGTVFWALTFVGLNELNRKYITNKRKKPRLILCAFFTAGFTFLNALLLCLNEGEGFTVESFVLPAIFAVLWVVTFVQLIFLRKGLWDADGEYGILPEDKAHILTVLGTVLVLGVLVVAANVYPASMPIDKKPFMPYDVSSSSEHQTAKEIRAQMLEWGVPQDVVDDLPDSEILNYDGAEFVTVDAESVVEYGDGTEEEDYDYIQHFQGYFFYFPVEGDDGKYDVRILMRYSRDCSSNVKRFYRAGLYTAPWSGLIEQSISEENNGDFIQILTEENGEKYVAEPCFTYNLGEALEFPKGFEYREEPGQKIYFAQTYGYDNLPNLTVGTVFQRRFYFFPYTSTADYMKDRLGNGYIGATSEKYSTFISATHRVESEFEVDTTP